MSWLIKRTTCSSFGEVTRYFMRPTALGPMFQTEDMAKRFDSYEQAAACVEEEELDALDGVLEIIESV